MEAIKIGPSLTRSQNQPVATLEASTAWHLMNGEFLGGSERIFFKDQGGYSQASRGLENHACLVDYGSENQGQRGVICQVSLAECLAYGIIPQVASKMRIY
jgi:hypothetical protein